MTDISSPIVHISADDISDLSKAYADSDTTIGRRVATVRRILATGVTVKVMRADMLDARLLDPTLTVYSEGIYGRAAATSDTIDRTGVAFSATTNTERADIHRAIGNVGVKSWNTAVKSVLASADDADSRGKLDAILNAAKLARAVVVAPKTRAASGAGGTGKGGSDDIVTDLPDTEIDGEIVGGRVLTPTHQAATDAIRAAVKHLQNGGELTRDMESAIVELTSAATAARKRARVAA